MIAEKPATATLKAQPSAEGTGQRHPQHLIIILSARQTIAGGPQLLKVMVTALAGPKRRTSLGESRGLSRRPHRRPVKQHRIAPMMKTTLVSG